MMVLLRTVHNTRVDDKDEDSNKNDDDDVMIMHLWEISTCAFDAVVEFDIAFGL